MRALLLLFLASTAFAQSATPTVTLTQLVQHLPDSIDGGAQTALATSNAIEDATSADREAAVQPLLAWLPDPRPKVRAIALLTLGLLYIPAEKHPEPPCTSYLPEQDIPVVAKYLRDPDIQVHKVALFALHSVVNCGHGLPQLVSIVLPMLRDPDILTAYPDPWFIESNQRMLATMTPEQQKAFKAMPRRVIELPAQGPQLLPILVSPALPPSPAVDDAIVAFLDRPDQTPAALTEATRIFALSRADARISNEALRRVFEQKAMTVFLLQFVSQLRLTPEQRTAQRDRLRALSTDLSAGPALRRAAQTVLACWDDDPHHRCAPTYDEFLEQNQEQAQHP